LVDSQEYKDILNKIQTGSDGSTGTLRDVISTYNRYVDINQAVVDQAEVDVPESGYDTSGIYVLPLDQNGNPANTNVLTADSVAMPPTADNEGGTMTADAAAITPDKKVRGWLTEDGLAPNGLPVQSGITFPTEPNEGDYCLRVDYLPNRLFRYDGRRWVKVEDARRTNLTPGPNNRTLRSGFVNNPDDSQRQGLSQALRPQADNE
jgi:hypothetical protein